MLLSTVYTFNGWATSSGQCILNISTKPRIGTVSTKRTPVPPSVALLAAAAGFPVLRHETPSQSRGPGVRAKFVLQVSASDPALGRQALQPFLFFVPCKQGTPRRSWPFFALAVTERIEHVPRARDLGPIAIRKSVKPFMSIVHAAYVTNMSTGTADTVSSACSRPCSAGSFVCCQRRAVLIVRRSDRLPSLPPR